MTRSRNQNHARTDKWSHQVCGLVDGLGIVLILDGMGKLVKLTTIAVNSHERRNAVTGILIQSIPEQVAGLINVACLDGSAYTSLTYDPAAMTGYVSYRDGGKAYDLLLAADGDLLKLYSDARQTCCFRKADARLLDGFIGESVAVHGSSQAHADLPAACAVTEKKIISKLLLRGDGTGTISYLDGSEYASLTYRTDTMTGELTDRTGKKKGDLVMAVDNGTLWLYSQAKQTLGFKVADTIPLEAYEGELTIRSYAAEGSEDLLALRRHNKQKVPSAVILGKDGKGEVRLEDGTVFFGFSFQASDMTLSADINGKQHNGLLCDKGAAQNIKS